MSGHIGGWVVCDPTSGRKGQHGTGSWVGKSALIKFTV